MEILKLLFFVNIKLSDILTLPTKRNFLTFNNQICSQLSPGILNIVYCGIAVCQSSDLFTENVNMGVVCCDRKELLKLPKVVILVISTGVSHNPPIQTNLQLSGD